MIYSQQQKMCGSFGGHAFDKLTNTYIYRHIYIILYIIYTSKQNQNGSIGTFRLCNGRYRLERFSGPRILLEKKKIERTPDIRNGAGSFNPLEKDSNWIISPKDLLVKLILYFQHLRRLSTVLISHGISPDLAPSPLNHNDIKYIVVTVWNLSH